MNQQKYSLLKYFGVGLVLGVMGIFFFPNPLIRVSVDDAIGVLVTYACSFACTFVDSFPGSFVAFLLFVSPLDTYLLARRLRSR